MACLYTQPLNTSVFFAIFISSFIHVITRKSFTFMAPLHFSFIAKLKYIMHDEEKLLLLLPFYLFFI